MQAELMQLLEGGHLEIIGVISAVMVIIDRFQAKRMRALNKTIRQMLTGLRVEHEILITDYCERKGITRDALPTRHEDILDDLDG